MEEVEAGRCDDDPQSDANVDEAEGGQDTPLVPQDAR